MKSSHLVMDNTDCWISEFDFRSLTVPSSSNFAFSGASSGYCSSEESLGQFKAINDSHDSKSLVSQQRQSESFRRADAFSGSSNVELAGVGTGSDLIAMEDCSFDFGTSPQNFDDLMDTFWNPIKLDLTPMDSLVDFDMADVSQSSVIQGITAGNSGYPGLATLASTTTAGRQLPSAKHGWQKRAASPSKEGPSLVKKPSNPLTAGGKTISAESQSRLKRVFDFQQQVAGLADMTVGDEEEYILQFSVGNGNKVSNHVAESTTTSSAMVTPASQGSALLGGVFSHRGPVPASLKNCETKALARVRGGAVASSCGALLRHSVSIPSGMKPSAGGSAKEAMQRGAGGRSQNSGVAHQTCARADMKGGRVNALAFALEDHRYTLKPPHNPPVSRGSRSRKSGTMSAPSSAASTLSAAPCSGKMSILEAFLRSTRPLDPNKGSNAALAAEGLAHLRLETGDGDICRSSGTILKKLLTGEIDQNEVHRCEQQLILERGKSGSALASAESILADDFGIGAELLLGESEGSDLLCDGLGSGPLWMNAENDEMVQLIYFLLLKLH